MKEDSIPKGLRSKTTQLRAVPKVPRGAMGNNRCAVHNSLRNEIVEREKLVRKSWTEASNQMEALKELVDRYLAEVPKL